MRFHELLEFVGYGKSVTKKKLIGLQVYISKQEQVQINDLTCHL